MGQMIAIHRLLAKHTLFTFIYTFNFILKFCFKWYWFWNTLLRLLFINFQIKKSKLRLTSSIEGSFFNCSIYLANGVHWTCLSEIPVFYCFIKPGPHMNANLPQFWLLHFTWLASIIVCPKSTHTHTHTHSLICAKLNQYTWVSIWLISLWLVVRHFLMI